MLQRLLAVWGLNVRFCRTCEGLSARRGERLTGCRATPEVGKQFAVGVLGGMQVGFQCAFSSQQWRVWCAERLAEGRIECGWLERASGGEGKGAEAA